MKLKEKLHTIVCITLAITSIVLFAIIYDISKNHSNSSLLLGNKTADLSIKYDDTFASDFMDSTHLLNMLKNNSSKTKNEKVVKISSFVKYSNDIYINIGYNDIKSVYDDEELTDRKIEIVTNNIQQIIEIIKEENKDCNIYLLALKYQNNAIDKAICELNDSYQNICANNNIIYIQ